MPYILLSLGFCTLLLLIVVLRRRAAQVAAGFVPEMYGEHGGLGEVYFALFRLYRGTYRSMSALKKLAFQYIFHILVRVLYYVKAFANSAYAFARNQFVKNAVKSKVSVSFFWSHLKEYKKQIEKEQRE